MAMARAAPAFMARMSTEELSSSHKGAMSRAQLAAPGPRVARVPRSTRVVAAVAAETMSAKQLEMAWKKPEKMVKAEGAEYSELDRLLSNYDFKFSVGDKVVGNCFNVDQRGAYIDIGAKAAAFLPKAEASLAQVDTVGPLPTPNLRQL